MESIKLPAVADPAAAPIERLNIYQKILNIMGELRYIQKGKKEAIIGPQQYRFVSHDQVTAAVHPLLVKYRVVVVPSVEEIKQDTNRTAVKLTVDFVNADHPADYLTTHYYGYGIDGGDKGPGKAISYAYKYALLKTFCLETGDDPDKDQNSVHEPEKCLEFDSMIPDEYSAEDINHMKLFLEDRSKSLGRHIEDIKREAVKRPIEFFKAVKRWKRG